MPVSHDKLVDAWMKQSELLWRTVYATPAVAIAIFAGWYVTSKDGNAGVSRSVLFTGILMMLVQWMIVHRMARYLNQFRQAVGDGLPRVEQAEIVLLFRRSLVLPTGYQLAISVPIILSLMFLAMLLLSLL